MMMMPARSVSRMPAALSGVPSQVISPSQVPCGYTPDSTFISVDLPAPFSPHKPTHSPGATVRSIPSSAFTPENALTMPRIVSNGCVIRYASLQGARSRRYATAVSAQTARALRSLARELGLGIEAVLDDYIDVALGEQRRLQQHRVDFLLAVVVLRVKRGLLALRQCHRELGGFAGNQLQRLVDRHGLRARNHALDRGE